MDDDRSFGGERVKCKNCDERTAEYPCGSCEDCVTPYVRGRADDNTVHASFLDRARRTIQELLDIIQQEVYPALNRVPDGDFRTIEDAQMEVLDLKVDLEQGLTDITLSPERDPAEVRANLKEMVDGMNEHWVKTAERTTPVYKQGFLNPIKVPYPEGCHPVTRVASESAPFVLIDSWKRGDA